MLFITSCSSSGESKKGEIKDHISRQLSFGPRLPGSDASLFTANYFKELLETYGWIVEFQEFSYDGKILRNVIARNSPNPPQLILGAHYDTRQFSDQDPDEKKQILPVPGAIDGASGSALMLELGKYIFDNEMSIWLVFFDGEDQGKINGWQWSIGSEYFAAHLNEFPNRVVILDMLGDDTLRIFKEMNSNSELSNEIWSIANTLGYESNFVNEQKHAFIDDHLPFINRGIPAALLIDFDYPYWHTTSDTLDKVSEKNLQIVLQVMLAWINQLY